MLKIVREIDPIEVKQLTVCLYAPPGIGKTSIGFTANKPLLLDFDNGAYRSAFRKDSVQVRAWAEVDAITEQDLIAYETVIVDTAGRALDSLTSHLIAQNPKLKGYGGALSLQGYGSLKGSFVPWLKMLHGFGKDVVLLAHMDEQRNGDEIVERLDVQGGSKGEIYKAADAMGRLFISKGARYLNFSPTDTAFGKNPAALPVVSVPDYATSPNFLGDLIATIKKSLNEASEVQKRAASELADWNAKFAEAANAAQFNALIPDCDKASDVVKANVKRLLVKVAKEKGFEYDAKEKTFKAREAV